MRNIHCNPSSPVAALWFKKSSAPDQNGELRQLHDMLLSEGKTSCAKLSVFQDVCDTCFARAKTQWFLCRFTFLNSVLIYSFSFLFLNSVLIWWFNRGDLVLGYLAQASLNDLTLHQQAWKKEVGWAGFKVSGNMWTQSTVLLSFFELLSGCCYGATSVPTSVSTGHQKNCHCTLQEHLKFPAVQAGASWVGNWPLHPLISLSPFQTYCCWFGVQHEAMENIMFFCIVVTAGSQSGRCNYMFALLHIALVKCLWEIWNLWDTTELTKHHSMKILRICQGLKNSNWHKADDSEYGLSMISLCPWLFCLFYACLLV